VSSPQLDATPPPVAAEAALADRFAGPPGVRLRVRVARGVIINAGFNVGVHFLGMARGIALAGLLTASQFGLWSLITVAFGTLLWLAGVGLDDKYIQQDHPDQEEAFQVAFTLQSLLCAAFLVIVIVAMPLFSLAYGRPDLIAPAFVLGLAMPAVALQTPIWVFYRRMDFLRQRRLQLWDPIVALVVIVGLALAGFGVWAAVFGTLAGAWAMAIVSVRASPYRIRLRWKRGALREYSTFSVPLFVAAAGGVLMGQIPVLVAVRSLGLEEVGAIALASSIALFAHRVDDLVTGTLYPAICAVRDQTELLFETFSKSNRLALVWAAPAGAGVVLFTRDFVDYVIGDQWLGAVLLIQITGASAALNQIGFNWTAFYRARGVTRPIAVQSIVVLVFVLAVAVPLLARYGLEGYAFGMAGATVVGLVVRGVYLVRLFPALRMARHVARAVWPTAPAVGVALLVRWAGEGRSPGQALLEVLAFLVVGLTLSVVAERRLFGESIAYLRERSAPSPA
jgi:O-antigen/teichoic acid export membrane protein